MEFRWSTSIPVARHVDVPTVAAHAMVNRLLKRIEVAFRRGMLAVLTRTAARSDDTTPAWNDRPMRVLFLRHDRIGDMVVSLGVIHAIAQSHPGIVLDVLASPINAPVLQHDPDIHAVVTFDRSRLMEYVRLLRHFRRVRYDVVVDSMVFGQSLTTLLLMIATRAPHRVGVAKRGKPNVYTLSAEPNSSNDDHMRTHLAPLVDPFGVSRQKTMHATIVLLASERSAARERWGAGRRFLVNISAGEALRRWPDDRYVAVARHLRESVSHARVLIMHAPHDASRADTIASAAGVHRADTPTLRDAIALVAEAEVVITPDTSIVHIASALDVPIVALFTYDEVDRWRPRATVASVALGQGTTMESVTLDDALRALHDVLVATGITTLF